MTRVPYTEARVIIVLFDSHFAAGDIGLKIKILISALRTSPTSSVQYVYSGQLI